MSLQLVSKIGFLHLQAIFKNGAKINMQYHLLKLLMYVYFMNICTLIFMFIDSVYSYFF